jgi:hypothetical protein
MEDATATQLIESLFYNVLENYLPGMEEIVQHQVTSGPWWMAEIPECNSYITVIQKTGPNPRPVSEYVWEEPADVPLGEYYMTLEIDWEVIGKELSIAMLEELKDRRIYLRFSEDCGIFTPAEAIGVMKRDGTQDAPL